MYRKTMILLTVITFSIITFGQNFEIPDFTPDSLTTWQVRFGGSSHGSLLDEHNYNSNRLSINPNGIFKYQNLRPDYILTSQLNAEYSIDNRNIDKKLDNYSNHINVKEEQNQSNLTLKGTFQYINYYDGKNGIQVLSSFDSEIFKNNSTYKDIYQDTSNYYDEYKNKEDIYNLSLEAGFVKGRIYDGSYAAKAKEIIEHLKNKDLLNKDLSSQEYKILSQIIMQKSARYHFDSRIKRNEALTKITDHLKEINALKEENSLSYITIFDIYTYNNFSFTPNHDYGLKFYGDIGYRYRKKYEADKSKMYSYEDTPAEKSEDFSVYYSSPNGDMQAPFIKGKVKYAKVLNYHLFGDINLTVQNEWNTLNITNPVEYDYYEEFNYNSLLVNFTNNWYYKLSTRSLFQLGINADFLHLTSKENYDSFFGLTGSIQPKFTYYITPKFSLSSSISYQLGDKTKSAEEYYKYIIDYKNLNYSDYNFRSNSSEWNYQISFNYYL